MTSKEAKKVEFIFNAISEKLAKNLGRKVSVDDILDALTYNTVIAEIEEQLEVK